MALLYASFRRTVKLPRKFPPPCRDIRFPVGILLFHGRKKTAALCAAVFLCAFIVGGYGLFVVHLHQLQQVLVAGLGLVLVALEQHVRTLGELAGQAGVTGLVH